MRKSRVLKKLLVSSLIVGLSSTLFFNNKQTNIATNNFKDTPTPETWVEVKGASAKLIGAEQGTFNFKYNPDDATAIIVDEDKCYSDDFYSNDLNFNGGYFDYVFPKSARSIHLKIVQIGEVFANKPKTYNTFAGCTGIHGRIEIPNTVKTIGVSAFNGCSNVTAIYLEDATNLELIDNYAFEDCTSVTGTVGIPTSVTYIGRDVFKNTDLKTYDDNICYSKSGDGLNLWCIGSINVLKKPKITNLEIYDGTYGIVPYAFYDCPDVKGTLTIWQSTTNIGEFAFTDCGLDVDEFGVCTSLQGGWYNQWCIGVLSSTNKPSGVINTIQSSVYGIASGAFSQCIEVTGFGTENLLSIPYSVKVIEKNAFYNMPKLVSSDDVKATLDLSNAKNLEVIGEKAFGLCPFRGDLFIPKSVKKICYKAFNEETDQIKGARFNSIQFESTNPDDIEFGEDWNGVGTLKILMNSLSRIYVPIGTKGKPNPPEGYTGRPNFGFEYQIVIEGNPISMFKWDFDKTDFQPGQTLVVTVQTSVGADPITADQMHWLVNYADPSQDNYIDVENQEIIPGTATEPEKHVFKLSFLKMTSEPIKVSVSVDGYPTTPLIRSITIQNPPSANELLFKDDNFNVINFENIKASVDETFYTNDLTNNIYDSNNNKITTNLSFGLKSISSKKSVPDWLTIDENTGIISGKTNVLGPIDYIYITVTANGLSGQSNKFRITIRNKPSSWTTILEFSIIGGTAALILVIVGTCYGVGNRNNKKRVKRMIAEAKQQEQESKPKPKPKPKTDSHKIWH